MIGSVQVLETKDLEAQHLPQVLILWNGSTMLVAVSPAASELEVVLAIQAELRQVESALRGQLES